MFRAVRERWKVKQIFIKAIIYKTAMRMLWNVRIGKRTSFRRKWKKKKRKGISNNSLIDLTEVFLSQARVRATGVIVDLGSRLKKPLLLSIDTFFLSPERIEEVVVTIGWPQNSTLRRESQGEKLNKIGLFQNRNSV